MVYDPDNIFAKILRGDIPCKKLYENEHVLAIHDIHPQAPVHVLVMPKGAYVSMSDFCLNATDIEIVAYFRAIGQLSEQLGLHEHGYRAIANTGSYGGQEVPHLHIHLLGGKPLGRMLEK